ncbi:MAG: hypothetical protein ACO3EH_00315 [Ilumatobacteraceae bacterium]
MKIAIQPTQFRVPGKGSVEINQLDVQVSSYSLGNSALGYYDLQTKSTVERTREVPNPAYTPFAVDAAGAAVPSGISPTITETYAEDVSTSYGLNGTEALKPEQFAAWGSDDAFFARSIAANLGLTPVE